MKFFSKYFRHPQPQIQLIQPIDVTQNPHYHEAVLFTVTNGMGALSISYGKPSYTGGTSQLFLNGIPLLGTQYPYCPTCSGILQRGYGIETIDCPALRAVSKTVNETYTNITDALKRLSPLLGLLKDGIYLLADTPHFPTDGDGHFFWNIPYQPTRITAACWTFYCHDLLDVADSFPLYLYPTQSTNCLNENRVEYYLEQFRSGKRRPHGIAFHNYGFLSALLDGHHKACAAALLGEPLDCLTIIPMTGTSHDAPRSTGFVEFCDISIPIEELPASSHVYAQIPSGKSPHPLKLQTIRTKQTSTILPEYYTEATKQFPEIHDCAVTSALKIAHATEADIAVWLKEPTIKENACKLKYLLQYQSHRKNPSVRELALRVLEACRMPDNRLYYTELDTVKTAFRTLLPFRDEDVEQVFIDYLVAYPLQDKRNDICDIVKSYWDDAP